MMEGDDIAFYQVDDNTFVSINQGGDLSVEITASGTRARDCENMSKKRIFKNMLALCFSSLIFYLGFQSLSTLQSTMNGKSGIGTTSQAVIFLSAMIACLLLPDLVIKNIGCKRTMVITFALNVPYLASSFKPIFWVIIPSAVLSGLAFGLINASYALYVFEMAMRYKKKCPSESIEVILAKFNGFFAFFMENSQIWGSLISYCVLNPGMTPIVANYTPPVCGIQFQMNSTSNNPNLQPPDEEKRYLLVSVCVLSAVIASVGMGLYADKLDNDIERADEYRAESRCRGLLNRLLATAKQAVLPDQILLLPITVFLGIELSFYSAEFTKAYIACAWGVHHVGFVTICFGVCGALTSLLVGTMVKYTSMMFVIILGFAGNIAMCVVLYIWEPSSDATFAFFLVAGVWGMGDAIWWSQVAALYGLMFPHNREAAFSNLYFWSFLGFFLSYAYANYFSIMVKINILIVFLVTGIAGYLIGQIRLKCVAKREYVELPDGEE